MASPSPSSRGNGGHSVSAQQKKANIGDEQKERLAMRECDGGWIEKRRSGQTFAETLEGDKNSR